MVYLYSFQASFDDVVNQIAEEGRKNKLWPVPNEKTFACATFQDPMKQDSGVLVYRGKVIRLDPTKPPAPLDTASFKKEFVTVIVSRHLKQEEKLRWKVKKFFADRKLMRVGDSLQVATPTPSDPTKSYPLATKTDDLALSNGNMIYGLGEEGW